MLSLSGDALSLTLKSVTEMFRFILRHLFLERGILDDNSFLYDRLMFQKMENKCC